MLCVGTVIMASSIVPLSLQEPVPKEGLDIACMSVPWLYSIGFSTAFSALFAKAWRINKVVRNSIEMQRVQVHTQDVIWPFALLTITNVAILTTWTIISPLHWTRKYYVSTDQYGRGLETYGSCSFAEGNARVFLLLLSIFNGLAVVFANYQSYLGRKNPTGFNESSHVAISMASLLECFLIGGPILLVVDESPEARFSVKTILVFVSCCAILLPMFIPKFTALHTMNGTPRSTRRMSNSRAGRSRASGGSIISAEEAALLRHHQTLGYINSRSRASQDLSEADVFEEEFRRARGRSSQCSSTEMGLASSVQQLRKNALRSSLVGTATCNLSSSQ